ncbi:hypothetical protein U1Q18_028349 [Sarracenia purpurea var. burkii]
MIRLVSVGNLEAAVSLLLSTHPDSMHFYANALRAVALSSAVSRSLLELAVKVVAANMVRTDRSLSGMHLLCAVGRYQEACSQPGKLSSCSPMSAWVSWNSSRWASDLTFVDAELRYQRTPLKGKDHQGWL